jgi:hypothetical protein
MSLGASFNAHANILTDALTAKVEGRSYQPVSLGPTSKPKRAAPFSLRLSEEERARLMGEAGGAPLGSYIKAKVLGAPLPMRRTGMAVEDRKALAQILALLGRVSLSTHLGELANLASTGSLPLTPETESELVTSLHDLKALRALLMQALGLRDGDRP